MGDGPWSCRAPGAAHRAADGGVVGPGAPAAASGPRPQPRGAAPARAPVRPDDPAVPVPPAPRLALARRDVRAAPAAGPGLGLVSTPPAGSARRRRGPARGRLGVGGRGAGRGRGLQAGGRLRGRGRGRGRGGGGGVEPRDWRPSPLLAVRVGSRLCDANPAPRGRPFTPPPFLKQSQAALSLGVGPFEASGVCRVYGGFRGTGRFIWACGDSGDLWWFIEVCVNSGGF